MYNDKSITLEDVEIIFTNFEGRETEYNRLGNRNFSIRLDEKMAHMLRQDGWNVKTREAKSEEYEDLYHLPVAVNYKSRSKPQITTVTSGGRTNLGEDECLIIDWIEIESCDIKIRPYDWNVSGKSGRKAYLEKIFVIVHEDVLDKKYRDVPVIGAERLELTVGDDPNIIDGEVVGEFDEEDMRLALPPGRSS